MEKFLEEILKSDLLAEDTKAQLRTQFGTFVESVKEEARKDVAEQYKRDRAKIIESADKMITDVLKEHMGEFAKEFAQVDALKQKYSKAIVEAKKKADDKATKAIAFMESTIRQSLEAEMKDLLEDRRVERLAVANTIKEAKERSERDHREFVKKGAKMIDFIIEKEVKKLLKSLHGDIIAARQNNFGRKMFEAFAAEYQASLFSHDAHAKALQEKAESAEIKYGKLREAAKKEIVQLRSKLTEAQSGKQQIEESYKKAQKTSALLKTLKGNAREQMRELLEAAPYGKLDSTFKKFLPVVTESAPATRKEKSLGSFHTGNKTALNEASKTEEIDNDLILLRKRANIA